MACTICGKKVIARGFCSAHYQKWRTLGDPLASKPREKGKPRINRRTTQEIFASYMPGDPPSDGCWDWTGGIFKTTGYGRIVLTDKSQRLAHRVSYELHHGPIPDRLFILHSCDRRICVNPHHLRAGTQYENVQDAIARGRHVSAT